MDIDVTAAEMLERLDNELNEVGIHIAFVELRSRLHDLLSQYGLLGTLDRDHFYGTIEEALAAIEAEDAEKAKRARGSSAPAQDDPL
jgi:MFS superfamily sulfate permease-like transporter